MTKHHKHLGAGMLLLTLLEGSVAMQINGEDCCPPFHWIFPINFCKNSLAARQTQILLEKFTQSCFVVVGPHHPNLSSNDIVWFQLFFRSWETVRIPFWEMSRPSSCSNIIVDGQQPPDSIKNLVNQWLLEFPNGVKRTYIYSHWPPSFRSDTMFAGICNLCWRQSD